MKEIKYPNIKDRFLKYKGWLKSKNVLPIKYEDLISQQKIYYIRKLADFYFSKRREDIDKEATVKCMIENIKPEKSHTFREGGSKKWKRYFTDEHKKVFKDIAGDLLIELGYEKDYNW